MNDDENYDVMQMVNEEYDRVDFDPKELKYTDH
jgi:hypothetical protein